MPRPKGVPNKVGAQVKENLIAVFNRLGGTHAMAEWAKRHTTEFCKLYARLIPTESHIDLTRTRDVREMTTEELLALLQAHHAQEQRDGQSDSKAAFDDPGLH